MNLLHLRHSNAATHTSFRVFVDASKNVRDKQECASHLLHTRAIAIIVSYTNSFTSENNAYDKTIAARSHRYGSFHTRREQIKVKKN